MLPACPTRLTPTDVPAGPETGGGPTPMSQGSEGSRKQINLRADEAHRSPVRPPRAEEITLVSCFTCCRGKTSLNHKIGIEKSSEVLISPQQGLLMLSGKYQVSNYFKITF